MTTRPSDRTTLLSSAHSFRGNIDSRAFHSRRFHLASTSQTTSIIIIALGALGGCALLFSLYRFIRRLASRRSAPLPPVQPIAHHRQQQLALLSERNNGSFTPPLWPYLPTPQELSPSGSNLSLPPSKEIDTVNPLQASNYSGENSLTDSPSSGQIDHLPLPKLAGIDDYRRNSISSAGSIHFAPPSIHSSTSTPSRIPHRHRLQSLASQTSRSTVGLPHGPHSQVKIVLPAPLAPPCNVGSSENVRLPVASDDGQQHRRSVRLSVADMWAPSLHRTASDDHIAPRSRGRQSKSTSPSRKRSPLVRPASAGGRVPSPLHFELSSAPPLVPADISSSGEPLQAPAS